MKSRRFVRIKAVLGPVILRYLFLSVAIGTAWFFVETSFIFVLQSFLYSLGLIHQAEIGGSTFLTTSFAWSLVILIAFGLVRAIVFGSKTFIANVVGQQFLFEQRSRMLAFVLDSPQATSTKEVVTLFTEVLNRAGEFTFNLSQLANTLIAVSFFLITGTYLAPYEMLLGVAILGAFIFPLKFLRRQITVEGKGLINEWALISESLIQGIKNFIFLKIYGLNESERQKGTESLRRFRGHNILFWTINSLNAALPMMIGVITIAVVTFVSRRYLGTPPVRLVAFFYIFIRLAQAASELNMAWGNLKMSEPSFRTIADFTETIPRAPKLTGVIESKVSPLTEFRDIRFENVSFEYRKGHPIIGDLSFSARMGDVIVIKGPSGSGKTTLISLLTGILRPTCGEILVNQKPLDSMISNWKKCISYVGPDPYLIAGTLRENLTYGLTEKLNDSDLWEALEFATLANLIRDLDSQLDENIFEIAQFSTGQRQRLAIARAFLRHVNIIVLDEATANLDAVTESKIVQRWMQDRENKLFFIVTHKDVFDPWATRIFDLGNSGPEVLIAAQQAPS